MHIIPFIMKKTTPRHHNGTGQWLRGLTAIALTVATIGSISAKPAKQGILQFTQPDGTVIGLTIQGDEFCHITKTVDGYPLLWDDNLGYVYADITNDGEMVATSMRAVNPEQRGAADRQMLSRIDADKINKAFDKRKQNARTTVQMQSNLDPQRGIGLFSKSHFPAMGEQKALVILVEFKDVKFDSKNKTGYKYADYREDATAHEYFTDLLNKEGFDGFGATGSCRDWFLYNSRDTEGNSQFQPEFDLYGPVTLANNMSYYGGNDWSGNDKNPEKMVIEACKQLHKDGTIANFADYDRDGDGYVDNVYVFYAGFGEADGGGANTVWPHSWNLSSAGSSLTIDGVKIDRYGCSNETDNQVKRPDGIGTFTHEFSHVMGIPDLYATTYTDSFTPGPYSVMDYGPYNNDGRTPPNYSAYERYALDWLVPLEYTEETEYTLPLIAEHNIAYKVPTSKTNEFFLCENRQQSGWDEYIPGHGMLIWHIDYNKSVFDSNKVNNTPSHQYVDLIEANGKTTESARAGTPFPGTANVDNYTFKDWSKKNTGVSFREITEDPETGLITKTAKNTNWTPDPSGIDNITVSESQNAVYYNLQGQRIASPAKGQIVIRHTSEETRKIVF